MRDFAKAPAADRAAAFEQTAINMGLPPAMVEKDFWVCWTLDYLFSRCKMAPSFAWKGGTTLSKAFGLINRFSEDIDLVIDWRILGYATDEPWEQRSNTKQDAFVKRINNDAASFLANELKPLMERDFTSMLVGNFALRVDEGDPQTLCFDYPRNYDEESILQEIRLESGALAAWTPAQTASIAPYVAERFPNVFALPTTSVRTVTPERTFWEKATILHQEANRPANKALPRRYARHYYDMYKLGNSPAAELAIAKPGLLARVVAFKEKFYRTPWAKLSEAKPGTLKLAPQEARLRELKADYDAMHPMVFGEVPNFDDVVAYLAELEGRINAS